MHVFFIGCVLNIALIGAAGATGSRLLTLGLDAGHSFRVLLRDPEKLPANQRRVEVVKGDIVSRDAARNVITPDCDAVISALGIAEPKTETTVFSTGVQNIVDAMRDAGVGRLVAISASGFHVDEYDTLLTRLAKPILRRFFKHTYADLARMERVIQESSIAEWTIFLPPRLTNNAARGRVRRADGHNISGGMHISRADLASMMLQSLDDRDTYGKLVYVAN